MSRATYLRRGSVRIVRDGSARCITPIRNGIRAWRCSRVHNPAGFPVMLAVRVECYSGRKADERPVRFGERDYFVEEVVDQWYGLDGTYFKLRADDGNVYLLRHDTATDEWTLEATKSS